jgi:hypothetical protein
MPSASGYVRAVTVNGEIYAVTPTSTCLYNPSTNAWTAKAPMPISEDDFAIATYQNIICVIGGCSGFDQYGFPINCTGTNQMYNPATNTWEIKAVMPTARALLQANVVDGRIYLIDGASSNNGNAYGSYSSANEVYDPANDSWAPLASDPVPGAYKYASAVFDNKIYVIGGQRNIYLVYPPNGAEWYDPENNSWSWPNNQPTPLPTWVTGAGAAATSGTLAPKKIYVINGQVVQSSASDNLNQIYDPETDSWAAGAPMPTARFDFGVAVVNDAIYAMGGTIPSNVNGTPTAVNEEYFPVGYQGQTPSVPEISFSATITVLVIVTFSVVVAKSVLVAKKKHRRA